MKIAKKDPIKKKRKGLTPGSPGYQSRVLTRKKGGASPGSNHGQGGTGGVKGRKKGAQLASASKKTMKVAKKMNQAKGRKVRKLKY